jgi:osmoprotectant transport system substrate-binding protein
MKILRRWAQPIALFLCTVLAIVACTGGSGNGSVIRIGSKDFPEQLILGEIYALALEDAGYQVERKLNLGGTPVAQAALTNNEIDFYPEYTGTALLTVLKAPIDSDPEAVYNTVATEYKQRFNLVWLKPAPMNNTQALAMTREKSRAMNITTISEFVAAASDLVLIGPPEFEVREDGLPGLKAAYGDFQLKAYKAVDPGLRYKGLVDEEADVAVAFGTDGEIAAFDLLVLEDDKKLFPPYQVAPVVRQELLEADPEIERILNDLSPLITDEVMQELNYEVTGRQQEPQAVARQFLLEYGWLEK